MGRFIPHLHGNATAPGALIVSLYNLCYLLRIANDLIHCP